jgi:hypothetical protein
MAIDQSSQAFPRLTAGLAGLTLRWRWKWGKFSRLPRGFAAGKGAVYEMG